MKLLSLLFFSVVLFNSSAANSQQEKKCALFGDNLFNCVPYECETSQSGNPKDKIKVRIIGLNSAGECVHEQANSSGEKVLCRYTEESRKFMAMRARKHRTDLANMPEGTAFEESILGDIFANECDVSSPHGDDKPVVAEDEKAESLDDDYNEAESGQVEEETDIAAPASEEPGIEDNGDLTEGE